MLNFLPKFIEQSKEINSRIVYDEINDPRIRDAVFMLRHQGFRPVVVGTEADLKKNFAANLHKFDYYITPEGEDPKLYAAKLLGEGKVDGFISGAQATTGDVLRALIKNVGSEKGVKRISGYFLMNTIKGLMIIADCAVQPNPNAEQLAEIAYLSAKSAKTFGIKPKIAMLSFSTKGSAKHEMSEKVVEATKIAKKRFVEDGITDVVIEGEIQLDAAINPDVAGKKIKDGSWSGDANILVFPDLNSGNIGYKLMQYFGGAQAIGPIIQGLNKPGNDLSRGCSIDDIMALHSITVLQTATNN